MKWEKASQKNLTEILDFLLPREHLCTALTSRFHNNGPPVWPEDTTLIAVLRNFSRIEAVLFISRRGLALPVFTPSAEEHLKNHQFPPFLRKPVKKIHTCIGTRSVVELLEKYKKNRKYMVLYYLMVQSETGNLTTRYDSRIRLLRAGPEHCDFLFPLHKGYEKEEVLIVPQQFNENFHRLLLKKNLSSQIIFYALVNGSPAGTAGTNAIGFSCCQLGSVYTAPEMRLQGIGTLLVARLCRELNSQNMKACLYAKQDNPAALALYKRLGFRNACEYQISYFS